MDDHNTAYYQHHIFCCTNERKPGHRLGCCASKGSLKLRNYFKARVKEEGIAETRVNVSGCLDRCALGPVMVIYPEGIWYHYQNQQDLDEIIESHLKKGQPVQRLILKKDQSELSPEQQKNIK